MRARSASFLTSAAKAEGFPAPDALEIAFAGRSNVGKSSLINALVGQPSLARTSSTPGRTQLLNWFKVAPPSGLGTIPLAFVDLPGYGYAKVPVAMRAGWQPLIEAYLTDRKPLRLVVLIVDARRGAEQEEIDLAAWLSERDVPLIIVATKIDKLAKNKREPALRAIQKALATPRLPIGFSAVDGTGAGEVWRIIAHAAHEGAPR
jgi:GTP-binding protein